MQFHPGSAARAVLALVLVLLPLGCSRPPGAESSAGGGNGSAPGSGVPNSSGTATPDNSATPPPARSSSAADALADNVFRQECANCHSIDGIGNVQLPLDGIGNWHNQSWLAIQIRHPEKHDPHNKMPGYSESTIPAAQLQALTKYLTSLKTPPKAAGS